MKDKSIALTTLFVGLILMMVIAGCSALSPRTSASKVPLEERINTYMQAQIAQDWARAYTFLNQSSRKQISREQYIHQTRKATYTAFEIDEINMLPESDTAKVRVRLDISFMGYELKRTPYNQVWVKEKGAWYVNTKPDATLIDE